MSEEFPDDTFARALTNGPRLDRPLTRYDFVLAVIPMAFLVSLFADAVLAVSTPLAMIVASLLGGLAVVDALFVNPPT